MTLSDAQAIRDNVETVDIVGSEIWDFGIKAEYRGEETNDNMSIVGGTPEYPQNNTHFVGLWPKHFPDGCARGSQGCRNRQRHCAELVSVLDPVGRDIRVDGRKYQVIGVFDEKKSAFGASVRQLHPDACFDIPEYLWNDGQEWFRAIRQHHGARAVTGS